LTICTVESIVNRMVENAAVDMDGVFHALASGPRRELLGALADGEQTVGTLASPLRMSVAAVSKHLKVLEGAGLVERRPSGRTTVCRLRAEPLAEADAWIRRYERFWSDALDRLEALVAEEEDGA
jgi:DNA-binding transcriptional ArsR family regulator